MVWPDVDAGENVKPAANAIIHSTFVEPPTNKDTTISCVYFPVLRLYHIKESSTTLYKPGEWMTVLVCSKLDVLPRCTVKSIGFDWVKFIGSLIGAVRDALP